MVPRSTITKAQIIEAAESVIAANGYAGATTRAIAQAAHCSEGSIYNHFPDKRGLFVQCALARNQGLVDIVRALPDQVGRSSVFANVLALLEAMLEFHRRLVPLLMTMWANGDEIRLPPHPEASANLPEEFAGGPHRIIAEYLEAERRAGRLRADLDCDAAAAVLMGLPFQRALLEHTHSGPPMPLEEHDYLPRTLAVVLDGMTAPRPRSRQP
jgi:AcrR family transcriptional regulator